MMSKKQLLLTFFFLATIGLSVAQSPLDLTSNVSLSSPCSGCSDFPPSAFFSSQSQIINAFNFARRAEETQLSLTTNSLGTLSLPSGYGTWSPAVRALYILNAERTARAGVSYGGTAVLGLPLEGLENNLTTIAQNHTQDMITNNFFAHTSPTTGLGSYQRIDNSATYGASGACREFMTFAENLYVGCTGSTTTPTYTVEQAMFSWIYQDAGSAWGHRRAALIQNTSIYQSVAGFNDKGFTNNVGSAASEGYLGIGIGTRVYSGTSYPSCGGTYNAHIVTMEIADPKPSCVANYVVLPIELLSFTGIYKNEYVSLKWATSSEKDNAYFIVERSANGQDFREFSKIKGVGTSNQTTHYALDDITPMQGTNYYRLIQVDLDGTQSKSQTIAVQTDKKHRLSVYPNPTNGIVNVSIKDEAEIELINAMGEVVLKTKITESKALDLSQLASGIYVLRSSNGEIQRLTKY